MWCGWLGREIWERTRHTFVTGSCAFLPVIVSLDLMKFSLFVYSPKSGRGGKLFLEPRTSCCNLVFQFLPFDPTFLMEINKTLSQSWHPLIPIDREKDNFHHLIFHIDKTCFFDIIASPIQQYFLFPEGGGGWRKTFKVFLSKFWICAENFVLYLYLTSEDNLKAFQKNRSAGILLLQIFSQGVRCGALWEGLAADVSSAR